MTKKLIAILLAVLCTISLFACGKSDDKAFDEQKAKEILKEMETANEPKALIEKYTSFEIDATDQDGSLSKTSWEAKDGGYMMLMQVGNGSEAAMTPKGNFIRTPDGESVMVPYQDPSEYESLKDQMISAPFYAYSEEEEVVEFQEENGKTTILTVRHMDKTSSGFQTLQTTYGITDETFDYYNQYVVDSETKELQESSAYFELSTGRKDIDHKTVLYGASVTVSDEMQALMDAAQ